MTNPLLSNIVSAERRPAGISRFLKGEFRKESVKRQQTQISQTTIDRKCLNPYALIVKFRADDLQACAFAGAGIKPY